MRLKQPHGIVCEDKIISTNQRLYNEKRAGIKAGNTASWHMNDGGKYRRVKVDFGNGKGRREKGLIVLLQLRRWLQTLESMQKCSVFFR